MSAPKTGVSAGLLGGHIVLATVDPDSTDDLHRGYLVGYLWLNTSAGTVHVCRKNDAFDAAWDLITQPTALVDASFSGSYTADLVRTAAGTYAARRYMVSADADPTSAADSTAGYGIGSWWVNETDNGYFLCVDATAETAVWIEVTPV